MLLVEVLGPVSSGLLKSSGPHSPGAERCCLGRNESALREAAVLPVGNCVLLPDGLGNSCLLGFEGVMGASWSSLGI